MTEVDLSTLSPEALRAELARREEEIAKVRREAEERQRQEKFAKAREARNAARIKVLQPVVNAINATRPKAFDDTWEVAIRMPKADADAMAPYHAREVGVHFPNLPEGTYRSLDLELVDATRIVVGTYGDKTSYPLNAKGAFNAGKIAEKFWGRIEGRLLREAADRQKANITQASKVLADAIRQEYGFSQWGGEVSASAFHADKVALKFTIGGHVTPEEARRIIDSLASLGLIEVKKPE